MHTSWQRQKIYSAADLHMNHPESVMAWDLHRLLRGGEGRIKSVDPLCTWYSAYKSKWDLCRCLLRTKTTQTDVFLRQGILQYSSNQNATSACQTIGKLMPSLYGQTNKWILNLNNEYQKDFFKKYIVCIV